MKGYRGQLCDRCRSGGDYISMFILRVLLSGILIWRSCPNGSTLSAECRRLQISSGLLPDLTDGFKIFFVAGVT